MALQERLDDIQKHGSLVAISVDTAEDSKRLKDRLGLQFPLLADVDLAVIDAYGLGMAGREIAVPTTFVVLPRSHGRFSLRRRAPGGPTSGPGHPRRAAR